MAPRRDAQSTNAFSKTSTATYQLNTLNNQSGRKNSDLNLVDIVSPNNFYKSAMSTTGMTAAMNMTTKDNVPFMPAAERTGKDASLTNFETSAAISAS